MKSVSIILINYNGNKDTLDCVESIKKSDYENYNIIVVDNASKKENYINLKVSLNHYEKVKLLRSDENLGFSGGNNLGIKYSLDKMASDYILLLNNDTLIKENTVSELVSLAEANKNCGICGAKIYFYPEVSKIWYAGGKFNKRKLLNVHLGENEIDLGKYDEIKKVDFITGCTMLIKKEVIEVVGLLPEEYFMYFEDADYSLRVREKGYSLYYNPNAIVYHKISASSGGKESSFSIEYATRNRKYFMRKFKNKVSKINYIYAFLFFYITRIIKIIIYTMKNQKNNRKALIRGLRNNI